MTPTTPPVRPAVPHFSSGPCAKRPGWNSQNLKDAVLGRSHRSKAGKAKLKRAIDLTREILRVPADYRIGIVPASDTGAIEMAFWSLLGPRPVTVLAWESFGEGWVGDIAKELKLKDVTVRRAGYGELPDLSGIDPASDIVFTWNGTTSGVRVPNADWIAADRTGLAICDATSAAFAQALDWAKLDVATFSWQKALGGEAAHGMLILSPRAVARLESYSPPWPLPKIFRMTKGGKLNEGIFQGETINTPSMLCVEDYLDALDWAKSVGGLKALQARADGNAKTIADWVAKTPWIDFLARDPALRSNTSVCLKVVDPAVTRLAPEAQAAFVKGIAAALEKEGVAYDIDAYRDAPAGTSHLVRLDGRAERRRGAHAVARLGLRQSQGRPGQSGLTAMIVSPILSPSGWRNLCAALASTCARRRCAQPTFLPGIDIRHGAILVDEARLTYPGDMLHEAGHIAVADPAERNAPTLSPSPGDELTTIAWSYAALRHLDIDPAIVFHAAFKGGGAAIIENFTAGHYFGVPLLQLYGMSCEPHLAAQNGVQPYPHMLRWMR